MFTPLTRPRSAVARTLVMSAALAGLGALAAFPGCAARMDISQAGPVYPRAIKPGPVVDVQVVQRDTTLVFTNTTANTLGPARLWLNQWFSREIPAVEPGQTVEFPLDTFRSRFGEPFRGGGFFAADKPDTLVLAQLQTSPSTLVGLVVVTPAWE